MTKSKKVHGRHHKGSWWSKYALQGAGSNAASQASWACFAHALPQEIATSKAPTESWESGSKAQETLARAGETALLCVESIRGVFAELELAPSMQLLPPAQPTLPSLSSVVLDAQPGETQDRPAGETRVAYVELEQDVLAKESSGTWDIAPPGDLALAGEVSVLDSTEALDAVAPADAQEVQAESPSSDNAHDPLADPHAVPEDKGATLHFASAVSDILLQEYEAELHAQTKAAQSPCETQDFARPSTDAPAAQAPAIAADTTATEAATEAKVSNTETSQTARFVLGLPEAAKDAVPLCDSRHRLEAAFSDDVFSDELQRLQRKLLRAQNKLHLILILWAASLWVIAWGWLLR